MQSRETDSGDDGGRGDLIRTVSIWLSCGSDRFRFSHIFENRSVTLSVSGHNDLRDAASILIT